MNKAIELYVETENVEKIIKEGKRKLKVLYNDNLAENYNTVIL